MTFFDGKLINGLLLGLSVLCAQTTLAHSRWILPSHTVLSSERPQYVSFDLSISNDIFHPDNPYGGIPLNALESKTASGGALEIILPDGTRKDGLPLVNVGRKSVSGFLFDQAGTYRVGVATAPVFFVTFTQADGTAGRRFGQLAQVSPSLPKGATNIVGVRYNPRVETFITRQQNTKPAPLQDSAGLSLRFDTHPNDLFAREMFSATLLLHGKPVAAGTEVRIIPGNTRYRNDRELTTLSTDSKGVIKHTWPRAGLYLVEAEVELESEGEAFQQEVFSYSLTLEVNPE